MNVKLFENETIKLEHKNLEYFFKDNNYTHLPLELKEKIMIPVIENAFSRNYKGLYEDYKFVNYVNKNNFIDVIKKLKNVIEKLENVRDDETMCVRYSSIWAVCTSFLQYKGLGTQELSDEDLYYTSNRCGVLSNDLLTVHNLIEEFDGEGYFEWISKY
jgi:hypothetical protein